MSHWKTEHALIERGYLRINDNQQEAVLLQDGTSHGEFKFLNFKTKNINFFYLTKIIIHITLLIYY